MTAAHHTLAPAAREGLAQAITVARTPAGLARCRPRHRPHALRRMPRGREGQHSIRINQQWRICFSWTDAGPDDVEIVDYH